MIKWFRQWRAWVKSEEAKQEEELVSKIRRALSSCSYLTAEHIIEVVRGHDKGNVKW
jgi:hypothetical protein